ncbi:hypothetical protein DFJ74DRAFT_685734 [Hyaloraphidium curvatum]|nr:hypothetical protein DFJ74DRAFT_685734 [Hyaloraphidium curvatum]
MPGRSSTDLVADQVPPPRADSDVPLGPQLRSHVVHVLPQHVPLQGQEQPVALPVPLIVLRDDEAHVQPPGRQARRVEVDFRKPGPRADELQGLQVRWQAPGKVVRPVVEDAEMPERGHAGQRVPRGVINVAELQRVRPKLGKVGEVREQGLIVRVGAQDRELGDEAGEGGEVECPGLKGFEDQLVKLLRVSLDEFPEGIEGEWRVWLKEARDFELLERWWKARFARQAPEDFRIVHRDIQGGELRFAQQGPVERRPDPESKIHEPGALPHEPSDTLSCLPLLGLALADRHDPKRPHALKQPRRGIGPRQRPQ